MDKSDLRVDWCSHKAAKFACENWHYSKSVPVPPLVKVGVWEFEKFIGVVIFSRGSNNNLLKPYNLDHDEGCELTRIALSRHKSTVSRIISIALKFLLKRSPRLKLAISFADPEQGHTGAIYQASNWVYCGDTAKSKEFWKDGKRLHPRQVSETGFNIQQGQRRATVKPSQCKVINTQGKHRYLMPLNKQMSEKIKHLAKPYPKREK